MSLPIPEPVNVSLLLLQWVLSEQACHAHSLVTVPLYDSLGPDVFKYIINLSKSELPKAFLHELNLILEYSNVSDPGIYSNVSDPGIYSNVSDQDILAYSYFWTKYSKY